MKEDPGQQPKEWKLIKAYEELRDELPVLWRDLYTREMFLLIDMKLREQKGYSTELQFTWLSVRQRRIYKNTYILGPNSAFADVFQPLLRVK